jgi:hypothetical protein
MRRSYVSSAAAYDGCQTDRRVADGDTLIIERERVVGLAATWPVAVTVATGQLHSILQDGSVERLAADLHWEREQIVAAVDLALARGWEVDRQFFAYAKTHR